MTTKAKLDPTVLLRGITAVVLVATGLGKIGSSFGSADILNVYDPIFNLRYRHLLSLIAGLEIIVALACLVPSWHKRTPFIVVWLTVSFAIYRFALRWIEWRQPCNCLGGITDALGISSEAADNISKCLLVYLFGSNLGLLFLQRTRL